jgi:uncharacterized protein YcfJ
MDNNNESFDYKRLGAQATGAASGYGAVRHMLNTTKRGIALSKYKGYVPLLSAYGALQGQYIGNKAYNVSKANNQIQKQAEWMPTNRGTALYKDDPNIVYPKHPSSIPNKVMSGLSRVTGGVLGATGGAIIGSQVKKKLGKNIFGSLAPIAGTIGGAYLGASAGKIDNVGNAYTMVPNI